MKLKMILLLTLGAIMWAALLLTMWQIIQFTGLLSPVAYGVLGALAYAPVVVFGWRLERKQSHDE